MPTLTEARIATLVQPYLLPAVPLPLNLAAQLSLYLDLLLRWNARTNLTAIRDPEEIVSRHFGESLFAGSHMAPLLSPNATLLDFGSGAGFPGLPIHLLLPHLHVTLAESQNKKATFLREAIRTLRTDTQVWSARAEALPPQKTFDVVTMRAVDDMETAIKAALARVTPGGWLTVLAGKEFPSQNLVVVPQQVIPVPESKDSFLYLQQI